ncbi:MAG: histidinol-phosphate transaminase [Isosphaeraceae bacterium]
MSQFLQPHLRSMSGYQPGEQPRDPGIVKLNTNENPYPPSPRVAEAIVAALGSPLRRYPDPLGSSFRDVAARHHGLSADMILPGNGSDDLLTIITRAFAGPGDVIVSPSPSYILYATLARIQGARYAEVSYRPDWTLDPRDFDIADARLVFLANPNSPSGTCLTPAEVAGIADVVKGVIVVDEAYVDFADTDCSSLLSDHPNMIVTRSFSKGYGLAGLRLGYLMASPEIVQGLLKVKDSYNCDTLSLVGAAAALEDREHLEGTRSKIRATRQRLTEAMISLGFKVPPSQANFVWCTGLGDAAEIYRALKERKILVRLMRYPGHEPGIRITVGTDDEVDLLLKELGGLV